MIGGVRMDYFNYPLDTKILYRKKQKYGGSFWNRLI